MSKSPNFNISHWFLVLVMVFATSAVVSCSHNSAVDKQLTTAENLMAQHPDSAMQILKGIDKTSISDKDNGKLHVLYTFGCVLHAVPLQLDSTDIRKGDDLFIGDFSKEEVKWLIVKSYDAKLRGNSVARLEYLKDAEFLAIQLDCKFELAMIYQYLAGVYSDGFNGTVSKYYADKSIELLTSLNYPKQLREAKMAAVGAICAKRDYKAMLESLVAMKDEVLANADESYKIFFLDQLARSYDENNQTEKAIQIWHSIYKNKEISSNTLAHMAYAYMHINRLDSAYMLIKQANGLPHGSTDDYLCRNVEYLILEKMGRTSELTKIDSLRNLASQKISEERKLEESSLALNQKYDSAARLAWLDTNRARERTHMAIFSGIILLILAVGVIICLKKRNHLLKLEHENDVLKIRSLQNNLFESGQRQESTSKKIEELFGSRFKLLDGLASSYFECKETGQEQKRIYAEVKTSLNKFSSGATTQELIDVVNKYKNGLMEHFKSDYPQLPASQYRLALYIFCGFSLPSISIFINTDLRNVYVYKSRLKSIISKGETVRKEEYLKYFSKFGSM